MEDFLSYLNNINNNDIYDYFNCYSSYIMSRKDLRDNIKDYRKKFLINYYYKNNNNISIDELNIIYNNYNDNYATDTDNLKRVFYINNEEEEKRDDDTILHYESYFKVYKPPEEYYEEDSSSSSYISDYYDDYDYCDEFDNIILIDDTENDDDI